MAESAFKYPPKPAPKLNIPPGASAKVQIIDSTSRITAPPAHFMHPDIHGFQSMTVPAYSFLVEQAPSGRKILFDLGLRKDWQSHPPAIQKLLGSPGWDLKIDKNVAEVLQENNIDVAGGAIESIIWSHWHFDHTGDVATFPTTTSLITGPGVKEALLPGYPANEKSPLLESDFAGREHKEISFDGSTLTLGRYRAVDFFNDGSFYLLDAPGHAIGHICGLARVTSTQEGSAEDTFVLMGGDTAHQGGEYRPTAYLPLPKDITPLPYVKRYASSCPGHIFEAVHPKQKGDEPYMWIKEGVSHDNDQALHSNELMQDFDASDDVLVVIAHDKTLLDPAGGIEWFPHGTLKNWKKNDCSHKLRWAFLEDFVDAVEQQSKL